MHKSQATSAALPGSRTCRSLRLSELDGADFSSRPDPATPQDVLASESIFDWIGQARCARAAPRTTGFAVCGHQTAVLLCDIRARVALGGSRGSRMHKTVSYRTRSSLSQTRKPLVCPERAPTQQFLGTPRQLREPQSPVSQPKSLAVKEMVSPGAYGVGVTNCDHGLRQDAQPRQDR
jgi:hypothetical protein